MVIICVMLLLVILPAAPAAALDPQIPGLKPPELSELPDILFGPTNLTAVALSDTKVRLSWQDNSGNESGFRLVRKEQGASVYSTSITVTANVTSCTDTGLKPNTTYVYRIQAYNANGASDYSDEISVKTLHATTPIILTPAVPTNLQATAADSGTIILTWKDNSDNEEGFQLQRKTEGSGVTTIFYLSPDTTTYKNTGLTPQTKYNYTISAYNNIGASNFSNEASVTTPMVSLVSLLPVAPTLLTALPGSDGTRIEITWKNNSTNVDGHYVYRRTEGQSKFTEIHHSTKTGVTGYADFGLTPGTKYYYYVSVYNSLGSDDSNILSATTTGMPPVVKPAAPSSLTAEAVSNSQINLSWKDNSSNETSFVLERSLSQTGGYTVIKNLPANIVSFEDTGLTSATTYFYRIKAVNNIGDSAYSPLASAATRGVTPPPTVPGEVPPSGNNLPPAADEGQVVLRFYIDNPQYYLNDTPIPMDVPPVIRENRTLLPIRFVATPLGAEVGWDAASRKVTIKHDGTSIEMWIDRNTALVNGAEKMIDQDNANVAPLIMPPGRTMLPLRFISENLGCQVEWDGTSREAKVTYPRP
jgi:titin